VEAAAQHHPSEAVPRWARWFVGVFLAAFLLCGFAGIEAWPLTGWRLFSHVRTPHQTTWQAWSVDEAGHEQRVAFSRLPVAFKSFTLIMSTFDMLSPEKRVRTCQAWADAARRGGESLQELRIYRLDWQLVPRRDGRPADPPTHVLVFGCHAPA
jgi:hypothetical protein